MVVNRSFRLLVKSPLNHLLTVYHFYHMGEIEFNMFNNFLVSHLLSSVTCIKLINDNYQMQLMIY